MKSFQSMGGCGLDFETSVGAADFCYLGTTALFYFKLGIEYEIWYRVSHIPRNSQLPIDKMAARRAAAQVADKVKRKTFLKANIPAGKATPAPPLGPELGQVFFTYILWKYTRQKKKTSLVWT